MDIHQGDETTNDPAQVMGVRIIIYIDDMLILADSKEEATQHLEALMFLLEALGFMINPEKSHLLPCQNVEFLWTPRMLSFVSRGRR